MRHIITSNLRDVASIRGRNDNFIICDIFETMIPPSSSEGYQLDVYHMDGMSMEEYEDYRNDLKFRYRFLPVPGITAALGRIASGIAEWRKSTVSDGEDVPEEVMLISACDASWNAQVSNYLTEVLRGGESSGLLDDTECLNLYRYFRFSNSNQLVHFVKTALGQRFVYEEDPLAFGYALMRTLQEGFL